MMAFDRVEPAYTSRDGCRIVWRAAGEGGGGGGLQGERAVVLGGAELSALADLLKRDAAGDVDLEDHASKVIVNSDVTQFNLRDGLFEAGTAELRRSVLEYARVEHEPMRLDVRSKEFYPSPSWSPGSGGAGVEGKKRHGASGDMAAAAAAAAAAASPDAKGAAAAAPPRGAGRADLALHQAILSASPGMVGGAPGPAAAPAARGGGPAGQQADPSRDLFRVMARRRSTRRFSGASVDGWMVDKILAAADTAPTAGNFQGFRVFYVRSERAKAALAEAANNQPYVAAPVVLVFCMEPSRVKMRFEPRVLEKFSLQDATLAASYSQLAASALGLSSIWIGMLDEQKVMDILGTDLRPSSILCIGHPARYRPPKARRHLRELVSVIE